MDKVVISKQSSSPDTFSKFVTWSFLLSPVLKTYGWGRYDFAFLFTVSLSLLYLVKYGFQNRMPKMMALYVVYCYISVIISSTSTASLFQPSLIRIFLVYLMFFDVMDLKYTVKSYKLFGILIISFFYLQEISFYLTGVRISGIFQFLPLNTGVDDVKSYYDYVVHAERSASFFSEPAHFVQALLPLLCIELFYDKTKRHALYAVLIIVALLLTKSGTALFGMAAVLVYYYICLLRRKKGPKQYVGVALVLLLSGATAVIYTKSEMGQGLLERQNQLSVDDHGSAMSGFRRIYRGYFVYDVYSPFEKITGLYNGERVAEKIKQSVVAYDFEDDDQYFNAVHNILLRTGVIGALIFIIFIIFEWKGNNECGKALLLALIVLMFISAIYLTDAMALFVVLSDMLKKSISNYNESLLYKRRQI